MPEGLCSAYTPLSVAFLSWILGRDRAHEACAATMDGLAARWRCAQHPTAAPWITAGAAQPSIPIVDKLFCPECAQEAGTLSRASIDGDAALRLHLAETRKVEA